LIAVNGQFLEKDYPPAAALVNLVGREVTLTVLAEGEKLPGLVTVKTLHSEMPARYREWVETNRRYVHEATHGRVGYLHIPDMGARGYAEFHRGYLGELSREGLIVDLRFNGGGSVSGLLLEKLARRRIGYDTQRWGEPEPYPLESLLGPVVALTNEHAGSDGDIFSHGFKLMKLGPLVGKRTWGGVVGIWPRQALVDGTFTTQPEYSYWFEDVGWGVENYGTDPDIEVDNKPQDYARGVDAQLERSIQEVLRLMEVNPPRLPDFSQRPSKALPTLPQNRNKPNKNRPNNKQE
jgi:tricorn protease